MHHSFHRSDRLKTAISLVVLCAALSAPQAWPQSVVSDNIASGSDITLGRQTVQSASSGSDILLNGTTVQGNLSAGGRIEAEDCNVNGNMSAGHSIQLSNCHNINRASAGHRVALRNTTLDSLSAGHSISLSDATVYGNAAAPTFTAVEGSRVEGTLSLAAPNLTLNGSQVNNIRFTEPNGSFSNSFNSSYVSNSVIGNGSTIVNGHSFSSSNGRSMVSVGNNSNSHVNGYTVKSGTDYTMIITPAGDVYRNGRLTSGGNLPKTWADYRAQNPSAPSVQGPGWREDGQDLSDNRAQNNTASNGPAQVLELMNNSRVTGEVFFEGGNGRIIVHQGSEFTGTVRGGKVERR